MKSMAVLIGAGALLLGGCTGGNPVPSLSTTAPSSPTPSPTSSSAYVYQQQGSLDSVTPLPTDFSGNQEYGIGLSDIVETDRYGTYRGLALDGASELFSVDSVVVTPAAATALTGDEVSNGVSVAVRFLVEEWIDSPLTWDDDPDLTRAWFEGIRDLLADDSSDYLLNSLLDPEARDFGTLLVDADVASWRETGPVVQYRPAPYEDGIARVAMQWIAVSDVDYSAGYVMEDGREFPASMYVEMVGAFARPVMLANGKGPFEELTEGSWTVRLQPEDGGWRIAEVSGVYTQGVSLRVDGGLEALPTLQPIPSAPPRSWDTFEVDGLTFGLPGSYETEDPADPILQFGMTINVGGEYSLFESDDLPGDWLYPRWAKMSITSWGWGVENPDWMVRAYGDSFVLKVKGASWAGCDVYPVHFADGSIREYVEVTIEVGDDRAYWFEAVLPQGEGLRFLRDFVASLELT